MLFPYKLKQLAAWLLRLKDKFRKKVVENVTDTAPNRLSVFEFQRAKIVLIKDVQKKAFSYLLSTAVNHAQNVKRCPRFI